MIEEGKMPTLYHSLDEVKSIFPAHCKMQIVAKDRLPNTFDYGVIELVSLLVDAAEHLAAMRLNPNATMMRIRGYWPGWRDRLRASDLTGGAIKKAAGKLLRDGFIEEVPALRTTHRSRHA